MDSADQVTGITAGTGWHFHFGTVVRSTDGPAGTLHGIVVDRPALAVTHVIIRPRRPRRALLAVPMTRVMVPMGERLVLGMTPDELRTTPPLGEDVLQMSRASLVEYNCRLVGHLDCILMDSQTRRVTNLVVRAGLLLGYALVIPVARLQAILGYRIVLEAGDIDLGRLERFRTHREAAHRATLDPP